MARAFVHLKHLGFALLLGIPLVLTVTLDRFAFAQNPMELTEETAAERARNAWGNGAAGLALDILDGWLQDNPQTVTLKKLQGDILATSRRHQEAVAVYDTVLARTPTRLDVRWAKWSVLVRSGQGAEAVSELQHMAQVDAENPLIQLRLVQELRKLDRLEEALVPYRKAVELAPDLLSWRLGMARTRFDVLDYQGAYDEVQHVLQQIPAGSPLEIPAQNLLSVIMGDASASERGRRSRPVWTPEATSAHLKEWASIRADAWNLFAAGRYLEAEPIYRKLLALNPQDSTAAHQLGLTLMNLGRCEDALSIFRTMANLDSSDEEYADTVFLMGQCLAELQRWEDAYVHFQILFDAAVEFEETNKNIDLPPGTRVLNKEKLARWLDKVRLHIPEADRALPGSPPRTTTPSEEELFAKIAAERLKPQKPLETRASLMGRDADFSWFRFVIPATQVMRDDFPTGDHQFIPLNPGDSFPASQLEIYLVFGLVSASYDAVPLTAQCFLERDEMTGKPRALTQDRAIMSMNDQSGFFRLSPPETGWTPGLYRCGLFVGEQTSAETQVDEVRFRIIEPTRPS